MGEVKPRRRSYKKLSDEELFKDISLKERCFQAGDQMRKDEILTDIVLIAGEKKFAVHKFILATNSDYFLAMFNGPLARKDEYMYLHGISGEVLDSVIQYLYSGVITITDENISDVLDAACQLLLMPLRDRCAKFLRERLVLDNCLIVFNIAKSYSLTELLNTALEFIGVIFTDLVGLPDFKELTVDLLIDIINLDRLAITSEDFVFNAALSWLHHDAYSRREKFSDVLRAIHLPYVDALLLNKALVSDPVISADEDLCVLIKSALVSDVDTDFSGFIFDFPSKSWMQPRRFIQCVPCIVAMGGPTISLYNMEVNFWLEICKCKPRHCPGMDVMENFIYVVGGSLEWKRMSSGETFNTETKTWKSISPMNTPRSNFGIVVHKKKVYAIGGYDGNFPLRSAEVYDPEKDVWSSIASLSSARDGACNLSNGDVIYTFGGYDGSKYLTSVEYYSDESKLWHSDDIPAMSVKRQNAASVVHNGRIYLIGGYFDDNYHSSVEVLDLKTNSWSFVSPMMEARHHAGASALNGNIFVCGGWSRQVPVNHVDVYNVETDHWRRVAPLPTPTMIRCATVNFPRKSLLKLLPDDEENCLLRKKISLGDSSFFCRRRELSESSAFSESL